MAQFSIYLSTIENLLNNGVAFDNVTKRYLNILERNYLVYIFYDLATDLTTKNSFIENLVFECETCMAQLDQELMIKICSDKNCLSTLTNSTVKARSTLFLIVGYKSPEFLYNRTIKEVSLFQGSNSIVLQSQNVTSLGTESGRIVTPH